MSHTAERPNPLDLQRTGRSPERPREQSAGLGRAYRAADFFVVRSPVEPFGRLLDWCGDAQSSELESDGTAAARDWAARRSLLGARLKAAFSEDTLRRALYFASPELEQLCQVSEPLTPNLIKTLTRYFMRAAGRETPFGLFAGVSVAKIAQADCFELGPAHTNRSATSVAVCYLNQILMQLAARDSVRDTLRHSLTSTLVHLDGRYRFTTSEPTRVGSDAQRMACVTLDLAATPQVDRAVAFAGRSLTPEELGQHIAEGGIPYADALEFARTLCQRGLLVPAHLPAATGPNPLTAVLAQLAQHPGSTAALETLRTVQRELAEADVSRRAPGPAGFRAAAEMLGQLAAPASGRHPLQTTLAKPAPLLAMSEATAQLFLDAADLIQCTSRSRDESLLRDFRARFVERYGTSSVRLSEALDSEVGVDFGEARRGDSLLKALPALRAPSASEPFDDFDRVRQRMLHRALCRGLTVCELDDDTLAEFPRRQEHEHEAESFAVVARLARDAEGKLSLIAPGIMPSALKMLARFCDAEPALVDALRGQAALEQRLAGDALLTDVAYLPPNESANVVVRPTLRDYEIPYLGKSGAPADKQIPIGDLYVQVHADRVQLYSEQRGKPVKIRISNALNHELDIHPGTYRFLAALQAQDEASLGLAWSWGVLEHSEFLPRVVRGSIVLSLARWRLSIRDLEPATSSEGARAFRALQQLRERLRLPRWLTRRLGDQRLPIDLDNELSVEELLHEARQQRGLALEELLPNSDQLILHGPEGKYAAEFVVPFVRQAPAKPSDERRAMPGGREPRSVRRYAPGSAWLYAKIYSAPPRVDAILRQIQRAVLGPLRGAGIDDWFYLPFADPHPHLRVRFKGNPQALHDTVLPTLQRALESELSSGGAWRLQFDTYTPEQERYGGPLGVELAEQIFSADSDACRQLIELCDRDGDSRWQATLLGIDRLLQDGEFDLAERHAIARDASEAYGQEFGADLATWKAIGAKYRAQTPRLNEILWSTPEQAQGHEQRVQRVFASRSSKIRPIWREIERARLAGRIHTSAVDLARSFAHMHAVRVLGVEARAHELVLFDFLKRLYASRLARTGGTRSAPPSTRTRA